MLYKNTYIISSFYICTHYFFPSKFIVQFIIKIVAKYGSLGNGLSKYLLAIFIAFSLIASSFPSWFAHILAKTSNDK